MCKASFHGGFAEDICHLGTEGIHRGQTGAATSGLSWLWNGGGARGGSGLSFFPGYTVRRHPWRRPGLGAWAAPGPPHGLLTRVDPLVVEEGWALAEGAAALCTHKGLLPGVDAPVAEQHSALGKGLAAVSAAEGPLASVQQLVLRQVGAVAEGPAALAAGEGLLTGVHTLMLEE